MRRIAGAMLVGGVGMMVAAAVGCRSLRPPVPVDQLNAQQARGYGVFRAQCGQCHYDRTTGSLHGPAVVGLFQKQSLPSGAAATDERVEATVLHGRNMMPAMGARLGDGDLEDLLAYLHTL